MGVCEDRSASLPPHPGPDRRDESLRGLLARGPRRRRGFPAARAGALVPRTPLTGRAIVWPHGRFTSVGSRLVSSRAARPLRGPQRRGGRAPSADGDAIQRHHSTRDRPAARARWCAEFSPFTECGTEEASRWLRAALEFAGLLPGDRASRPTAGSASRPTAGSAAEEEPQTVAVNATLPACPAEEVESV